jgi:hypothetical protein
MKYKRFVVCPYHLGQGAGDGSYAEGELNAFLASGVEICKTELRATGDTKDFLIGIFFLYDEVADKGSAARGPLRARLTVNRISDRDADGGEQKTNEFLDEVRVREIFSAFVGSAFPHVGIVTLILYR